MNLLNMLTSAADEEQLRLNPLPEHAAATQEEHLRRHYALLLAAVLTSQEVVSEPQTRLLRLLLDALKLGDIRGPLFEQVRELSSEPLLEAARLIREAGFAHHLVLDVLVLLRLDAPLSDEAARMVGELATFLGLDEPALGMRVRDAIEILGLQRKIEEGESFNASKEADSDDAEDAAKGPTLLAELWPSRLPQPLTDDALRRGLQGGLWILEDDLDAHFPWQANDTILLFRDGATLNTFAGKAEINLTTCRLIDAVLNFHGACSITLERCHWQGDYDPDEECTALDATGPRVTITDCQFSTRNARAILVDGNCLTLTGSRFTHCGHPRLNGGAVWHSDHERTIKGSRFDRCLAARGGALWVNEIYGVNHCEFVECESRALQGKVGEDLAVYAGKNTVNPVLSSCVFRYTSVNVGDSFAGSGRNIAVDCQFVQGNLYYCQNYNHKFGDRCTFDSSQVIDKSFS